MKQVLLTLQWYDHELHKGVSDYSSKAGWHLVSSIQGFDASKWRGDGLITRLSNLSRETIGELEGTGVSIVDVQSRPERITHPLVATELDTTVQMAFEYFRHQKGFQNFSYFGNGSSLRGKKYVELLNSEGFHADNFHCWFKDLTERRNEISDWIRSLSFPRAIYCDNDTSASTLTSILLELGIVIPDQVSVLGTDNYELICDSSYVPISSIDTGLYHVGYKAAELLHAQMNGQNVKAKMYAVRPQKIVERASTDTLAVKSDSVRAAINIMRQDYPHQLTISDVVADLAVSQSSLERAFKRELGITPAVCLRDIRMREAAKLLRSTASKVEVVSRMVGIPNSKHFATLFKRFWALTPRQYRVQTREQN